MTMPVEQIQVVCPNCAKPYQSWYRASMNLGLDSFSPEYIERMSSALCPHCGHKVSLSVLVVRPGGVWEIRERGSASDAEYVDE